MLIAPLFVFFFSSKNLFDHYSIWEVMGLRAKGLFGGESDRLNKIVRGFNIFNFIPAVTYPLLLTMLLFLGPLSVQLTNGIWKIYSGE